MSAGGPPGQRSARPVAGTPRISPRSPAQAPASAKSPVSARQNAASTRASRISSPVSNGIAYRSRPPPSSSTSARTTTPGPRPIASARLTWATRWDFAPNQRWRGSHAARASGEGSACVMAPPPLPLPARGRGDGCPSGDRSYGAVFDPVAAGGAGSGIEAEPVEAVGTEAEEVRPVADGGEAGLSEHLEGDGAAVAREIELDRLRTLGEIRDDEDALFGQLAREGQHGGVARPQELDRPAAEGVRALPGGDETPHRVEQRGRRRPLCGDVDRLVAVDRVGDDGQVESTLLDGGEAGVPVPRPLHGRAHAVAVAEIDVVAHADLVAVIDDR